MSIRDRTGRRRAWQLQPVARNDDHDGWMALAGQFVAALGAKGSATLVARRTDDGLAAWVVTRATASDDDAVAALAEAVAARPVRLDEVPTVQPQAMTEARVDPSAQLRGSQFGAGADQVAEAFRIALHDGETVLVSVRQPSKRERRRMQTWHERRRAGQFEGRTHYANEPNTVLARVVVCAADRRRADAALQQFMSAIPGFDLQVGARRLRRWLPAVAWTIPALVGVAVWATVRYRWLPEVAHDWVASWWPPWANTMALSMTGTLLVAALTVAGWWPTRWRHVRAELARGWLDAPRKHTNRWWHAPLRALVWLATPTSHTGNTPNAGRYPLTDNVLFVGAAMVAPMVSPHGGAAAGAQVTRQSDAPPALLERIGPALGPADDGSLVHIPAAHAYEGVGLVGAPGSGKTQIVRSLFGWHCHNRIRPQQLAGWPTDATALIAFESKSGTEANVYRQWATSAGDTAYLFDVADPDSWAIDMFAHPVGDGTLHAKAAAFTDAMTYAFAEGEIQGRSREALLMAFTGGLVAAANGGQIADQAGINPERVHPVELAHTLLVGDSDEQAAKLAAAITEAAVDNGHDPDLAAADQLLQPHYGAKTTPAQRRQLTEAARNKTGQLREVNVWWAGERTRVTFDQILTGHKAVVINTGPSLPGTMVGEKANQLLGSLLMWYLKDAISRICGGWQDNGQSVVIFSDELAQLSGSSGTVLTWLREQGRAFGVKLYFATQHFDQLDAQLQRTFSGFGTMLWFRQNHADAAEVAAKDLSVTAEGQWSAADVASLAEYEVLLRTSVDGRRQPPVPVTVAHWEADMGQFATAQGWQPAAMADTSK